MVFLVLGIADIRAREHRSTMSCLENTRLVTATPAPEAKLTSWWIQLTGDG